MPYGLFRTLYSHNPGIFIMRKKAIFFRCRHMFIIALAGDFFNTRFPSSCMQITGRNIFFYIVARQIIFLIIAEKKESRKHSSQSRKLRKHAHCLYVYPSLPICILSHFAEFLMILCCASDFIFLANFLLAEAIRFATCSGQNYPISFAHRTAISIQFWHCGKIPPPSRYLVSSVARLMPCPPIG